MALTLIHIPHEKRGLNFAWCGVGGADVPPLEFWNNEQGTNCAECIHAWAAYHDKEE